MRCRVELHVCSPAVVCGTDGVRCGAYFRRGLRHWPRGMGHLARRGSTTRILQCWGNCFTVKAVTAQSASQEGPWGHPR